MHQHSEDGLIVWYDLMSTDPAATDAFYADVFGWTVEAESAMPNGYRMMSQNGEHFGGVLPWDIAMSASSWMSYIQISQLDELVHRATELGGTIHVGGTDIPGVGRFAIVADPTGAPFYLFDLPPERRDRTARYNRGDGFPIWNELITTDVDTATRYYEALIGWKMVPTSPGKNPYTIAKVGPDAVAGLFQPATPPAHSMWIVSFQTSDIDATIEKVLASGGTVIHPASTVSGIGRTAWVADPTGAIFGLMQPESGWLDRL